MVSVIGSSQQFALLLDLLSRRSLLHNTSGLIKLRCTDLPLSERR